MIRNQKGKGEAAGSRVGGGEGGGGGGRERHDSEA